MSPKTCVGHRSTVIGDAIVRIDHTGHEVIRQNHLATGEPNLVC